MRYTVSKDSRDTQNKKYCMCFRQSYRLSIKPLTASKYRFWSLDIKHHSWPIKNSLNMFYRNTLITDRGKSWADDTIFWGGSNFDPRPQSWNHRGYPETDPLETSKYTIYTTILKHNHEKQEIQHWHAHQTKSKNEELSKILRLWQKATKTKNTKY